MHTDSILSLYDVPVRCPHCTCLGVRRAIYLVCSTLALCMSVLVFVLVYLGRHSEESVHPVHRTVGILIRGPLPSTVVRSGDTLLGYEHPSAYHPPDFDGPLRRQVHNKHLRLAGWRPSNHVLAPTQGALIRALAQRALSHQSRAGTLVPASLVPVL